MKTLAFYFYFLYIISVNCSMSLRSILGRIGCVWFSFLISKADIITQRNLKRPPLGGRMENPHEIFTYCF